MESIHSTFSSRVRRSYKSSTFSMVDDFRLNRFRCRSEVLNGIKVFSHADFVCVVSLLHADVYQTLSFRRLIPNVSNQTRFDVSLECFVVVIGFSGRQSSKSLRFWGVTGVTWYWKNVDWNCQIVLNVNTLEGFRNDSCNYSAAIYNERESHQWTYVNLNGPETFELGRGVRRFPLGWCTASENNHGTNSIIKLPNDCHSSDKTRRALSATVGWWIIWTW